MGVRRIGAAALIVPGLWESLWRNKIHEFEHDPRLCGSMMGQSDEELEVIRLRWLDGKLEECRKLGIGSPRERHAAGELFVFPRWVLGRNMWNDDYIREHPLVCDRSVRWLSVDAADKVTVSEVGP